MASMTVLLAIVISFVSSFTTALWILYRTRYVWVCMKNDTRKVYPTSIVAVFDSEKAARTWTEDVEDRELSPFGVVQYYYQRQPVRSDYERQPLPIPVSVYRDED